jgi:mRNA interferase MazF
VKRGELYRVRHPSSADPRKTRVFVIVGRQAVIESRFSTIICAPVYSAHHGLPSQVAVSTDEGLKHDSAVHCDELISLSKAVLTDYIGSLSPGKVAQLNRALVVALGITADAAGA